MGRPIEMPELAPEQSEKVEISIDESGSRISVETSLEVEFNEGLVESAKLTLGEDRETSIQEGITCATEILLLMNVGVGIDKPVDAVVTTKEGEKYKLTFEKI